ncbi:MAG: phage tail protein [Alphaproteobacteria bacterium]|nr:phage tail protein [Alphaproteobacteria bacterium]
MKLITSLAAGISAAALASAAASAQADPYVGDIMLVGFSYCPQGWLEANGQVLSIADYQVLYSLVGTTYGGNGVTTFALPNLQGRIPVGVGQGPGLSPVQIGQPFGQASVILSPANLAQHTHVVYGASQLADTVSPENATPASFAQPRYRQGGVDVTMDNDMVSPAGGTTPVDVHAPTLGLRYCVAMDGMYPQRPN